MRGAGEIPLLNYDPKQDSQIMDVFESGTGKMYLETFLLDALAGHEDPAHENVSLISWAVLILQQTEDQAS